MNMIFPRKVSSPHAFTLIELLVVIVIIGVLAGLILPIYSSVQRTADKTTCVAHLSQIISATNLAAQDNNGSYPDLHGFGYEPGSIWIADGLAPYVGGMVNSDPTKLLRCPAAEKNQQEAWLQASQYCQYKYNVYRIPAYVTSDGKVMRPLSKPLVSFANAMVFFDVAYPDWTQNEFAHFPGSNGALVNVAYADGHVASLSYVDYKTLNPNTDESKDDFFTLGWIK